jgi:NAD(P)-dependent dehydrogenase (short-subunit alcohol dehydrogenase family)
MDSFKGKVAVVTGGGSGIGRALVLALAREGARIVVADIDDAAMTTVAGEVRAHGVDALAVRTDVTDLTQVQALADRAWQAFGGVHVLCNNAGVAVWGGLERATHRDWQWVLGVNLWGVIHGVEAFVPRMIAGGEGGHIVNTASMAGLTAAGQITSYVMTKHAIVGLSLALRSEAVSRGVGVLAVCPSAVETPILDKGAIGGFVGRDYYLRGQGMKTAYSADRLARDTLKAIGRNKALLVKPKQAYASWVFARLAPGLLQRMSIRFIADQRKRQHAKSAV